MYFKISVETGTSIARVSKKKSNASRRCISRFDMMVSRETVDVCRTRIGM